MWIGWLLLGALARGAPVVFVPLRVLRPPPERPEGPPRDWVADRLMVEVQPGLETTLDLRWTLRPLRAGPLDLPLLDSAVAVRSVSVDGQPAALAQGADGWLHLDLELDRPREVRVLASAATPSGSLDLKLAGASRRVVQVRGPWEASEEGAVRSGSRLDGGAPDHLRLSWKPAGARPPQGTLLRAEEATALRLDATGVEATAILRYRVIHGSLDSVSFRLPAGADALDVRGDGVLGVERQGEAVRVRLARPVSDKIDLHVNYRAPPLDTTASALPLPWAESAATQGWATLLRGDEGQFVPEAEVGAEAVSARDLPGWAQGLSEGDPIASYRLIGEGPSLSARVVHWEPIEGPPTVIDEARYEVAAAAHGREILRVRYQVRNDRRQFLRLDLPDQLQLISATVAGHAVQAARDAEGHLLIPLEKSVETMEGLVTFPVDIAFWDAEPAWERRGRRTLLTPTVDAPIAYARWELVLPPGYDGRPRSGNATPVADWSSRDRGLSYGHSYGEALPEDKPTDDTTGTFSQNFDFDAVGQIEAAQDEDSDGTADGDDESADDEDAGGKEFLVRVPTGRSYQAALSLAPGAARGRRSERKQPEKPAGAPSATTATGADDAEDISQTYWNRAYDAYKSNDYSAAEELLDQSLAYNANNKAAAALKANVEVLLDTSGKAAGGEDEATARRVRELAKAKTGEAEVQQQALQEEANAAVRSGDYAKAEEKLAKLEQVSGVLASVEQSEAVEKKNAYKEVRAQLSSVRQQLGKEAPTPTAEPPASAQPLSGAAMNENSYLLDGVNVSDPQAETLRALTRQKRHESIDFLKQIIADRSPQGDQRAEMMLRLADLYAEEGHDRLLTGGAEQARPWLVKAQKLYQQLLASYPQYARADQASRGLADVVALLPPQAPAPEATPEPTPAPEEVPLRPGYATVILGDEALARQLREDLVVEPDLADLLTGQDLVWDGDEDLRTEVVFEEQESSPLLLQTLGTKREASSASAVDALYGTATPQTVAIPHAGQVLRFEARLLPEGQPMSVDLSYRSRR